tara:strand:- start:250 stop:444 length:195 start_codon:yes stop_codon:yes gene_type:complete
MSMLAKYTEQAKTMSGDALTHAIDDIKACWLANEDWQEPAHPYGAKLWAEWDAYIVELQKRRSR